jgi:hypothetical protein
MIGCMSGTVIGLSDIYLLELPLPSCNTTVRIAYYGMCALHSDEPYSTPWCSGPMMYGMNRGLVHQNLFGYRPDNGTDATMGAKAMRVRECRLGMDAVEAGMDFQDSIVLSVETGAMGLFALGMLILGMWNAWNQYPVWKTRYTTRGKFPEFTTNEEVNEWEIWRAGKARSDAVWAAVWWSCLLGSTVVAVVGCISVWQIASALAYATTKWESRIEVRTGQRVWMIHWAIAGLQVLLLAGLYFCTRTTWLHKKWETALLAQGSKIQGSFWRARKSEWPGSAKSERPMEREGERMPPPHEMAFHWPRNKQSHDGAPAPRGWSHAL